MTKIHFLILAAFVVAFFLPVLQLPIEGGKEAEQLANLEREGGARSPGARLALNLLESSADGTLVGHEAARFVWDHLLLSIDEGNWKEASQDLWWNLANPLFALTFLLVIGKRRGVALLMSAVAAASAGRWLMEENLPGELRIGYWLWFGALCALAVHCLFDTLYQMRGSTKFV